MKKAFFLLLSAFAIISCEKDKDPALQGKWNVQNVVYKEYANGTLVDSNTDPGNGMTIDFQDNGNVVITEGTSVQSYSYIIAGNKVTFDGDTYEIRDLGENNVTIYFRQDYSAGTYDEAFANLTR